MTKSGLFAGQRRFRDGLCRHSLSFALIAVLIVQSLMYQFMEWPQFVSDQQAHGQLVVESEYWRHY